MRIDNEPPDRRLVRQAMRKINNHFENSNHATGFTFAMSYLAAMIVYYEMATGQEGSFNYEKMTEDLKRFAKAGHNRNIDTVAVDKKKRRPE